MTVVATFELAGEPVSKARARFTGYGSKVKAYTPESTKTAEEAVAWAFRLAARRHQPRADECYGVEADFYCGTRQRRDVDNMMKLVLDALNGLAWLDDSQVTEIKAVKNFTDDPTAARTVITVYRRPDQPRPFGVCEHCQEKFPAYRSQSDRRFCSSECNYAWRRAKNKRICEACDKPFQTTHPLQRFCTAKCAKAGRTVTQFCAECGAVVTRDLSSQNHGRPFCAGPCRATFWRKHHAKTAEGTCQSCGGPTSKKSYHRCRACVVEQGKLRGDTGRYVAELRFRAPVKGASDAVILEFWSC